MSGVLLDTHVLLWLLTDDPSLGEGARATISGAPTVLVSSASVWEIELKRQLGKFTMPVDWFRALAQSGVKELPITWQHASSITLDRLDHRDPFDTMLVSQALSDGLQFLTADRAILSHDLPGVLDARR